MVYAKFIDEHNLEYAQTNMVFDNIKYVPVTEEVLKQHGYKEVVNSNPPEEKLPYDFHWENKWVDGEKITQLWFQVEDDTTPQQRRQNAYQTRPMIEFGNEIITVDEARNICDEYMYDGTDRAAEIISELAAKIAEAKELIRSSYPYNN